MDDVDSYSCLFPAVKICIQMDSAKIGVGAEERGAGHKILLQSAIQSAIQSIVVF